MDFRRGADGLAATVQSVVRQDPFCGTIFVFRSNAGSGQHSASFCSESGELEGLVLLETLVELGASADDFADASVNSLGFERGDGDLPGRRRHQLRCGKDARADQLVNRADANAEPDRRRIGADCLGTR